MSKKGHDEAALLGGLAEALAGAALVLDEGLRIRAATPAAGELLGFEVPIGASAPKVLCGDAPKRPVAEALAAGRPIEASIARPTGPGETRYVRVRTRPLRAEGRPVGWLLLLEPGREAEAGPMLFHGLWTQDPRMKDLFRVVERVAGEEVTVLVRGETGAGKELVARALHDLSPRRAGPFRAINCAALPGNLLESELFGHVKGAFTGAHKDTPGHVQLAHRGTLFLDEVAELPLELQAKLLRVVETRAVVPVGARDPVPVDVRFVSATHRALRREVEAGRFRADLMYRLRVIPLFLPALREREGDVGLLCERFIAQMNASWRRTIERVSPAALAALEHHDWPGNVRELKNVLSYAYAIGDGPSLEPSDLPPELLDPALSAEEHAWVGPPEPTAGPGAEARRLLETLERAGGSRERAAKILGLSRVTLWRRMKQLGIAKAGHEGGSTLRYARTAARHPAARRCRFAPRPRRRRAHTPGAMSAPLPLPLRRRGPLPAPAAVLHSAGDGHFLPPPAPRARLARRPSALRRGADGRQPRVLLRARLRHGRTRPRGGRDVGPPPVVSQEASLRALRAGGHDLVQPHVPR